jgi:hypothetical protein
VEIIFKYQLQDEMMVVREDRNQYVEIKFKGQFADNGGS